MNRIIVLMVVTALFCLETLGQVRLVEKGTKYEKQLLQRIEQGEVMDTITSIAALTFPIDEITKSIDDWRKEQYAQGNLSWFNSTIQYKETYVIDNNAHYIKLALNEQEPIKCQQIIVDRPAILRLATLDTILYVKSKAELSIVEERKKVIETPITLKISKNKKQNIFVITNKDKILRTFDKWIMPDKIMDDLSYIVAYSEAFANCRKSSFDIVLNGVYESTVLCNVDNNVVDLQRLGFMFDFDTTKTPFVKWQTPITKFLTQTH